MSTNRYAPVPWKLPECYAGAKWNGWLVFLGRNRDSDLLTEHNFDTALEALEGPRKAFDSSPDAMDDQSVQVVREGHWACGWIEWIAIHPSNKAAVDLANELAHDLDQYPVLDEDGFSEKESEAAYESWKGMSVRDRYELIKRVGNCSIFAARQEYPPDDTCIEETLRSWS